MAHNWNLMLFFKGYVPVTLTLVFCFVFSWFYTRRYASRLHSDHLSYVTVISGLMFSLLTTLLIPTDVFFASSAKLSNGSFAEWASNSSLLQDVEDTLESTYYGFYSIVLIYLFLILPFVYFYSEDRADPILESTMFYRIKRSLMYTAVFPFLLACMLTIGAVIPMRSHHSNGTDISWFWTELSESKGQDAFGFAFSSISVIGVCTIIMYLGLGMMAFPLSLIRGLASAAKERADLQNRQAALRAQISALKARVQMNTASQQDYDELTALQQEETQTMRHERFLSEFQTTWGYKARRLLRPMQIFLGFGGLTLSILVVISLLLSNVDKVQNSDATTGYVLNYTSIPNPIDYVLLEMQKATPLDYIFFATLICYLFVCCIYSIQRFGLWFLCFKAYSIRRGKTLPQALVMMSGFLILCVFGLNILIYAISPLYTSFGSQHYNLNGTVLSCDYSASPKECVQTRATALLSRFNYKMAVFGFGYYWLSWLFILVSVGGFFIFQFKKRLSAAIQRDIEEEDEDLIG